MEEETISIIMAALSTLSPPQLTHLTHSILSQTLHHHHRLSSLLSSPSAFSLALHHLHSLSLSNKSLLIANHLLSTLRLLTRYFQPPHPSRAPTLKHRDHDAGLLLLLLCDVHRDNPDLLLQAPHAQWRQILIRRCTVAVLAQSGMGVYYGGVLLPFIEMITRCWRFVGVMGGKERREVAAAAAAVVALPAVEVKKGGGGECVVCREEMKEGRDVCELPCGHLFHWICILRWLKMSNSCPCCRFQLPTDDVFAEIQRLWSLILKTAADVCNCASPIK